MTTKSLRISKKNSEQNKAHVIKALRLVFRLRSNEMRIAILISLLASRNKEKPLISHQRFFEKLS